VLNEKIRPAIWFREVCLKNGLWLSDHQLSLLERYAALLLEWNKKINLISRKDEPNIWPNHILHCASLLFKFTFPHSATVVDIGTGGGLPGIPLKIIQPDLRITLVDSTQKKIEAIHHMISYLGLDGISAIWGRAEDVGRKKEFAGKFDIAVARAVAPLRDLIVWSKPFLRKRSGSKDNSREGGEKRLVSPPALIAMKGGDIAGEIEKAAKATRGMQISIENLQYDEIGIASLQDKKVVYIVF
jgi:16S rRNA (guanine527-N7)-methyltransferase